MACMTSHGNHQLPKYLVNSSYQILKRHSVFPEYQEASCIENSDKQTEAVQIQLYICIHEQFCDFRKIIEFSRQLKYKKEKERLFNYNSVLNSGLLSLAQKKELKVEVLWVFWYLLLKMMK